MQVISQETFKNSSVSELTSLLYWQYKVMLTHLSDVFSLKSDT